MARPKGSTSGAGWRMAAISDIGFRRLGHEAISRLAIWGRMGSWSKPAEPGNKRKIVVEERRPWPEEIRLSRDKKTLTIRFDDGREFPLPAEYLRVLSP